MKSLVKVIIVIVFLSFISFFSYSLYKYYLDLFQGPSLEPVDVIESKVDLLTNEKKDPVVINRLSLFMVGDCLVHSAVYGDAQNGNNYDFKPMISEIKPIVQSHDLAFYNQETILGGKELGLSTYPRFNSPYEVGDAFVDAGFNLVALANNHTLDRGEQAILNSKNYWNQKDVYVAGSYLSADEKNAVIIKEKNGISYAFFAYTDWTNGLRVPNGKSYLLDTYLEEQVKNDIEKVRDRVDIIMISMHFGTEYSHSISNRQREIASYLSSLGVDIVIGHHPHVVEPIEFIDDTLVIYSLGNFLSAQRGVDKLTGLMFSMEIIKTTKDGITEISFDKMKAGLVYTHSNYYNGYRTNFKVIPYQNLTESILSNHETYYNKYMDIVLNKTNNIERWR